MTAISKKVKSTINKKHFELSNADIYKMITWAMITFSAARGKWCDIPIAFIGLILAVSRQEPDYKAAAISGFFISTAIMSLRDISYIPYFISSIIYLAFYMTLKKEKYSIILSFLSLGVTKILLVYFSYTWQYKIYSILEALAGYVLCSVIQSGEEIIKKDSHIYSCTDFISVFISILTVCIALTGFDSFLVYMSAAIAISLSWFYSSHGRITIGLISLVVSFLMVLDKKEFGLLFISLLAIWVVGVFCAEKNNIYIYPSVFVTALVVNLALIYRFTGFAFVTTTIVALLIYAFLPYILEKAPQPAPSFVNGHDWRQLACSMNKLQSSLNFLASCAIDISRLNEKNLKQISIEDLVTEDVCKKCENNMHCWQQKYSFTYEQFSEYAKKMYWQGENDFSKGFYSQCNKIGKLKNSFEENSRLLLSKKYILQSQKNNQKLLQSAFLSISSTVGDMLYKNQTSQLVNSSVTMIMDKFLEDLNINHTYCLCSQKPDKMNFSVLEPVNENDLYKIQLRLEKIYSTAFSNPICEKQLNEILYTFNSKPKFDYELFIETGRLKLINGDNNRYFVNEGKLFLLLSDGMGTGTLAAAESNTVIAMAKSMIVAGVGLENAINIVNLAMNLKGSGESSASLDILSVDLFTGESHIIKAGAGETIVIDENDINRYYEDSLPLGVLKNIKIYNVNFHLDDKQTVIMASDGVGIIDNSVKNLHNMSCEQIAKTVISQNNILDDKTVIVMRLKIN